MSIRSRVAPRFDPHLCVVPTPRPCFHPHKFARNLHRRVARAMAATRRDASKAKVPKPTKTARVKQPTKASMPWRRFTALLSLALISLGYVVPLSMQPPPGVESWLMFDGVCNLCDGFVNFVADGDSAPPSNRVRFGAQQKHMELLERVGAPTDLSTLILIQGDRHYLYSTAALRTLAVMGWPWRGLAAFSVVPAPVRDAVYKLVAAHRYHVFGKTEECRVPSPEFRRRFIDHRAEEEEADPVSGLSG